MSAEGLQVSESSSHGAPGTWNLELGTWNLEPGPAYGQGTIRATFGDTDGEFPYTTHTPSDDGSTAM